MPRLAVALLMLGALIAPTSLRAQSPADSAGIRGAALDYIEGFYEGEDALVLGSDVAHARLHARLQLGAAVRVAGRLVAVRDARVDDHERGLLRHADEPVLERSAVEQHRVAFPAEQRRRLVEDADRSADGAELGAAAGLGKVDRLEAPVRDLAERERDGDLERGRRRQARPGRQVRAYLTLQPDRRTP